MDKAQKFVTLSRILQKSQKVNLYNTNDNRESSTLAHSFLDIEESFNVIFEQYLPNLMTDKISEEEINEILLDIGEEFKHIIYHIKDPKFYDYLFQEDFK